ncbi:hypothetical protein OSB04_un001351 [Centaurea solstitialis]|uniref:Uncharacterized protein n=1 Tax=Centaurea solstitialis TaxID=347529 RepID=A0AA38SAX4_9ASTR|nr:hypothetical protein OSB04_un001351 [Centaurea solstitialis]
MADQREHPSSPIDPEADRALIEPTDMVHILQNNEYVILSTVRMQHTIVREILRAHPLLYAMTATADVPGIYLQQFWKTAVLDTRFGVFSIIGRVDNTELVITMEDIRRILRLPAATDGGHQQFDELVSGPILLSELLALGVTKDVNGVSQITTSDLPPIWAQLYNLMNRCLSSKTKGLDKATTSFWHIFHSVAYGRHIDIAAQLWLDITKDLTIRERTRHHSIPWLRFYGLIIRDHMERNPDIPRRSGHSIIKPKKISWIAKRDYTEGQYEMQIPDHVLNGLNQRAPSVIRYRNRLGLGVAPMDHPEPEGPAQGAQPVPSSPRALRPRTRGPTGGASGSGSVMRVDVRENLGSIIRRSMTAHEASTSSDLPKTREERLSRIRQRMNDDPQLPTPRVKEYVPQRRSTTRLPGLPTVPESPEDQEPSTPKDATGPTPPGSPKEVTAASPEEEEPAHTSPPPQATTSRLPTDPSGDPSSGSSDTAPPDSDPEERPAEGLGKGKGKGQGKGKGKGKALDDDVSTSSINASDSVQLLDYSGTEGRTLNTEAADQAESESWMKIGAGSEGFEGESQGPVHQEAEQEEAQQDVELVDTRQEAEVEVAHPRQPEIGTHPSMSLSSTQASHTDPTRPMPSSQVVGSQPTQMHTQAIHSTTSQQVVVSSDHGAIPPIPPFTHSELIGVESRDAHPQHSLSFAPHRVLEPLDSHLATSTRGPAALDATPVVSAGQGSTFAGLSLSTGFANEPVLTLSSLEPRDSDGILKAVQSRLEAIEKADAAKDRRLEAIEKALAVKEQEDQARRAEIEALRKADEDRQKELDEARRLIKGKFQEGERPSFGDSSRSPTPVLRLQPPPIAEEIPGFVSEAEHQIVIAQLTTQNDALQRQVDQYKQLVATRDMQLEIALRRIRELEATCRSQAQPSKRGHDDPDDAANPHEGEGPSKRARLDLPSGSGTAADDIPVDTTPPADQPADIADPADPVNDDSDEESRQRQRTGDMRLSPWFPHEKVTPAIDLIDPNTAPLDPSDLRISDEGRKILNQHAQSLRFWKRSDDVVSGEEYDAFLPTVQTPEAFTGQQPIRLGWNHTVIFRPFLEESFTRIFQQESLFSWSKKVFFGLSHVKKRRRRTAYIYQRKLSWSEHGQIRRKLRFTKVTDVRPYKFGHQLFLEFHVRMYNPGKPDGELRDFMFTEADLDSIDLDDLLTLIRHLEGPILKPGYFRDGLEVLKRYVRHSINLAHLTDYQMAIESKQQKVNLLRPNLEANLLDQYLPYFPTELPEHGVVYITFRKNQRRFMRFSELSSFCDGTLLYVYNGMKRRLMEENMPMYKGTQWKRKLKEALNLIEVKLKERLMLRRVETAMELRTRSIREWDEYLQLSQWEPALNEINVKSPIPHLEYWLCAPIYIHLHGGCNITCNLTNLFLNPLLANQYHAYQLYMCQLRPTSAPKWVIKNDEISMLGEIGKRIFQRNDENCHGIFPLYFILIPKLHKVKLKSNESDSIPDIQKVPKQGHNAAGKSVAITHCGGVVKAVAPKRKWGKLLGSIYTHLMEEKSKAQPIFIINLYEIISDHKLYTLDEIRETTSYLKSEFEIKDTGKTWKYLFRLKDDDEEVFGVGILYLSTIGALLYFR